MQRRQFLKTTALGATAAPLLLTPSGLRADDQKQNPRIQEIRSRIKPVTKDERADRRDKARKIMAEKTIDALLLEGGVTLEYFTGVKWWRSERLFCMVLPREGDAFFIAPKFEEGRAVEQLQQIGEHVKLYTWEEDESPFELLRKVLSERNLLLEAIGVEESTRFFVSNNLNQNYTPLTLIDATAVTAGCRSVKSDHELELMQIANDITREVYEAAVPQLREGMTEREFAGIVSKLFSDFGVNGGALVLFGEASAYPHGMEKQHTLQNNEIVLIDGGCSVEGYNSDVTRTVIFGTPTDKQQKVFDIVLRAQTAALEAAKPGVPGELMDYAARKLIVENGYGPAYKYFTHRLGHGIGLEGHEWYYLVHGNKRPEQAGFIHSNEPGIYLPGQFGIRIEDSMTITQDGARILLPRAVSLTKMFA